MKCAARVCVAVVSAAFLLCVFACGPSGSPSGGRGQSSGPARPTPPEDLQVFPAATVYSYYDANEIRGDRELKDKWFAVTGTIEEVNKDILGAPYVCLRSREWIFGVQCMFPRSAESSLTELLPGQQVTIAGKCAGKMGNVLMRECRFYAPEPPAQVPPVKPPPRISRGHAEKAAQKPANKPEKKQEAEPVPERPKPLDPVAVERAAAEMMPDDAKIAPPKITRWWPDRRTWTDTSGQFELEADFMSYAAGLVKLKKLDGSVVEIPMERLSEEDQRWIRKRGR